MRMLLGVVMFSWLIGANAADLVVGETAPGFSLKDQHGIERQLSDYRGKWLVMYFYPKDDTPGCTTEACEFRDDLFMLNRMGVGLLGVSLDDVTSHQEFAEKYHLPFSLLSDANGSLAESYGALFSLGPLKFAKRHTFVIDPQGKLAKIYRDVSPKVHSDQVISDLADLMQMSAAD